MFARFASRLPSPPALVVSDSAAFTPYMSHVVPGCEFLPNTATDRFVRTSRPSRFTAPDPCQPLCAPHFAEEVAHSVSIKPANTPSLPRESHQSTYSKHAEPIPPKLPLFHRSGNTENCCQRCMSVECSRVCGVMK